MEKQADFIYCDNRRCSRRECLRRYVNAPWGVLIRVDIYHPDKAGNCKHEITQAKEQGQGWESMMPMQMSLVDYLETIS